jgi:YHS domain-containing protein
VLWVLIGWQFALGEYLGGIAMIALMALLLRAFIPRPLEERAREHARRVEGGHQHHSAASAGGWRERLTSAQAWSDVAHNFRGDWQMLWREIAIGFLLAGFVAQLGNGFFGDVFLRSSPPLVQALWGAAVGPLIAVLSFVCSVGNVPLAAVLWSGGISFAGVMAFIFADLIVLPILAIYRKYYGAEFAVRVAALMLVTMIAAALAIGGLFSAAGLVPATRPARSGIFGAIHPDYRLALDLVATAVFAALIALTVRRGATDPVCGMTVDRATARRAEHGGRTQFFCSEHCQHAFAADPGAYAGGGARAQSHHG